MGPFFVLLYFLTAAAAQGPSPLAGVWTLNRSLSEVPREIGFSVNWIPPTSTGQGAGSSGGGRGRRGSAGGASRGAPGSFFARESYEDARRVQVMTAEARHPAARLIIVDGPAAITMTNELGQSRSLHPDGRQESIDLGGVPALVTTKRDGDRLVVLYYVERDREVRYTYSHGASPSQLIVDVQFLEHGAGDRARLVYEPGTTETATPFDSAQGKPADSAQGGRTAAAPAASSGQQTPEKFDARPGAELRGIRSLGILVEDLSAQAVACGLNHEAIEGALLKRLTDSGFTVRKNSDDDTYVYINVMTNTLSNGTCVSRYDAFLYTHATANLSYHDQPVLVQVSLMHRGGIGSSAPAAHAAAIARALEGYVELFATMIRDANR